MSGTKFHAGVCMLDATPPAGLAMSGFAARSGPATGAHDPLSVRAVVLNDTAIVVADVIGLEADSCARIRAGAALPDANVIVAATHTHGGPMVSPRRLGKKHDPHYLARLESLCVEAIGRACAARQPAALECGEGPDPGVARNRRHANGPVDPHLPVLRVISKKGQTLAVLASYACHPVTLGADNRLYTGDYPFFTRRLIEARTPGAIALFLTGCAGDLNTGHSALASMSAAPDPARTFAEAERLGNRIAEAALAARLSPVTGTISAQAVSIDLHQERSAVDVAGLAKSWRQEMTGATPARAALLAGWIEWAGQIAPRPLTPVSAHIALLDWCGFRIAALPGEIFSATGLGIRARLLAQGAAGVMTLGYANGCPGYIPPRGEFAFGGYEVEEAHRYYGEPAAFAPGSAERLADAIADLAAKT